MGKIKGPARVACGACRHAGLGRHAGAWGHVPWRHANRIPQALQQAIEFCSSSRCSSAPSVRSFTVFCERCSEALTDPTEVSSISAVSAAEYSLTLQSNSTVRCVPGRCCSASTKASATCSRRRSVVVGSWSVPSLAEDRATPTRPVVHPTPPSPAAPCCGRLRSCASGALESAAGIHVWRCCRAKCRACCASRNWSGRTGRRAGFPQRIAGIEGRAQLR